MNASLLTPALAPVASRFSSRVALLRVLPALLSLIFAGQALAQSNNVFNNRTRLSGDNVTAPSVAVSTSSSKESGEPSHSSRNQDRTLWWEWVAPQTATYVVDTAGSAMSTILAVYEGAFIDQLHRVVSSDNPPGNDYRARATLTTTAGTAYQIVVAPATNSPMGNLALSISYAGPASGPSFTGTDSFNSRPKVSVAAFLGQAESFGSQKPESGEPSYLLGDRGYWWQWTAPANGLATVDLRGETIDAAEMNTAVTVYAGTAINTLSRIRSNDNAPGTKASRVTFPTAAGQVYQIVAVAGGAATGTFRLAFNFAVVAGQPTALPGHNDFNQSPMLMGDRALGVADTTTANDQNSEPQLPGARDRTVWWRWTAPANGTLEVDTAGSLKRDFTQFDTVLGVYRGTAINQLTLVASNDDEAGLATSRVSAVKVTAGALYHIVVAPGNTHDGNVLLNLKFQEAAAEPFAIMTHPVSKTVSVGATSSFTVSATGPALTYQWQLNGTDIASATGTAYTVSSVTSGHAGNYRVVVRSGSQTLTSDAAELTVTAAPVARPSILAQPRSSTVNAGSSASFTVSATGVSLSYQWQLNSGDIPDATSPTFSLSSATTADAGTYRVVVSNSAGAVTSSSVTLTVIAPTVAPSIAGQPVALIVASGNSATFRVQATGNSLRYQWQLNGTNIPGATASTYTAPKVSATNAGRYRVVVSNSGGTVTSADVDLTVTGRLVNLSVRTTAGTGNDTLIVGFSLSGGSKQLLLRGVGPTLGLFGVAHVLPDPVLTVLEGTRQMASNDNWGGSTMLANACASVGAFGLPVTSLDSVIYTRLAASSYTAQMAGKAGATGIGLLELYDASSDDAARLANLSARCQVGTGDNVLIVGFNVTDGPITLLVRGVGPTLGFFGVGGTLADPKLQVFSGSTKVAENDNWSADLASTFASAGAFVLAPGSRDAALRVTLQPGSYTAQVSGVNGSTGVALVEVYELP